MPYYLPVPPPKSDDEAYNPPTTAETWEQAAPTVDAPKLGPHEGSVTMTMGLSADPRVRDEWMGEDIFVVPRIGVMNGEQLFIGIPDPPPEGHGEYAFAQDGPKIDHSTRNLALFWSDWIASTAGKGLGGSFTGEHVVIARAVPGSTQGYMPTFMEQPNNARNMPTSWDANIVVGQQQQLYASMAAATSQ